MRTSRIRPARPPWSLRRRLVVTVVAMLALVSAVVGVVSVVSLQRFLDDRLDAQLSQAADRTDGGFGGRGENTQLVNDMASCSLSTSFGPAPAQNVDTITAVLDVDGLVVGKYTDADGDCQQLNAAQAAVVAAAMDSSEVVSIDLGSDLGEYRMKTGEVGGYTVATALPTKDVRSTVTLLVVVIVLVTLVGMIAIALAATVLVRLALRPLDRVEATATRVAHLQLERGEVELAARVPEEDTDERTEVGRVGAAFNTMLDHVGSALQARQASENKVRQFVADASHELRTPLAAIRGYAELPRRTSVDLSEEATYSLDRIEAAATRMTSLVEDLLLLARLDEGRDLEHEEVDLTRVVIEALSDAHAAGPDHEWDLELPEEPLEVRGDGFRIHQVVANLLTNARVHTPAGTRVVASLEEGTDARGRRSAVVSITDSGQGIAPELVPVLFERFARGDSSRARTTGSTGLGLAIVAAVVEAHDGTVEVDSEPGRTVFRVTLPID